MQNHLESGHFGLKISNCSASLKADLTVRFTDIVTVMCQQLLH